MKKTRRSYNSTLPAGKPLKRKGKSRFPKRRNDAYRKWIRTSFGCLARGDMCSGRIECAHVRSRGAGGDDVGNCIALCTHHHRAQHDKGWWRGISWHRETVEILATEIGRRWREQQGETAA